MVNFDYTFCTICGTVSITHAGDVERVTCLVFSELRRIFDLAFHLIAKFRYLWIAQVLFLITLISSSVCFSHFVTDSQL